jgi:MBOAT family.
LSSHEKIAKLRTERSVAELPSVIETLSYFFFYGGCLVGPCFELNEYLQFTSGHLYKMVILMAPSLFASIL